MKKIDLGQTVNTLANVGVIGGLIFLGFEMQQNTNIARAAAYRENVQDIAAWRSNILSDPELAGLNVAYGDGEWATFDEIEQSRVSMLVNNILGSYENAFFARNYGTIGDTEWERFLYGACDHYLRAIQNGLSLRFTTTEFRKYLEVSCSTE